ncbi:MAG: hypothetical protein QOF51_2943 [Chloroflexota bacterium]|jgi:hypothetical protein|nr:hypothetical protein [Chloroflexota bacterium]
MSAFSRPDPASSRPAGATLAVNAGNPYDVIAFGFSEERQHSAVDIGLPQLSALVLIRPDDEPWVRDAENEQRELICVLDPAEPESQIGAFTFMGRVSGFRDLSNGRLAVEFTSVGPIMPHFLRT